MRGYTQLVHEQRYQIYALMKADNITKQRLLKYWVSIDLVWSSSESSRVYRRQVCLSQATMADSSLRS